MNSKKEKIFRYDLIFGFLLLLSVVILAVCSTVHLSFLPYSQNPCADFSQGWLTDGGQSASLTALPDAAEAEASGEVVILKKILPNTIAGDTSLNFRSKNVCFSVAVDGVVIYEFYPDLGNIAGKSYGSCFHSIALSPTFAGKSLTLILYPNYGDNSCFINMLAVGSSGAYYQSFMRSHFFPFLMCAVIMILGFIMLLLSFTTRGSGVSEFNLQSLGTLSLMIGCWSAQQTLVPQMLLGLPVLLHGLNYLILILLPYPVVQFVNSILHRPRDLYSHIALSAVTLDLSVCLARNFFGSHDFHESLPIIHAVMLLTSFLVCYMFIDNERYCRKNHLDRSNRLLPVAFFVFIACCLADLYGYIASGSGSDDAGFYMRGGFLAFCLLLFVRSVTQIFQSMKLAGKAEAMYHIAYTDTLTGIPNRAAFVKREQKMHEAIETGKLSEVLVCQFDINDLKTANDTYGHDRGDQHICSAAHIISDAFGKDDCFRIGGDEFSAFVTAVPVEENFARRYQAMKQAEAVYNSQPDHPMPLHIACGKAVFNRERSLAQAEQEADQAMYASKSQMKNRR